jgi:hypothetical protein
VVARARLDSDVRSALADGFRRKKSRRSQRARCGRVACLPTPTWSYPPGVRLERGNAFSVGWGEPSRDWAQRRRGQPQPPTSLVPNRLRTMNPRPTLSHKPEAVEDFRGVQAALRLWWRDLDRLIEYVEPVTDHQGVYSHRLFELLVRAATEFESLAKTYATHSGASLPTRPTIVDYHALLAPLSLADVEVGVQQWRPKALYVKPFGSWASGRSSPEWYAAYNSVKHSRRAQFGEASLVNAVTAAAGVFATLLMAYDMPLWPAKPQHASGSPPPKTVDLAFEESPFTLRVPWGMV